MSLRRLSFTISVAVAAQSSIGAAAESTAAKSIYNIVNSTEYLITLVAALNAIQGYDRSGTGLVDVLSGERAFTLFGE
jgi:hypothetical protein